MGRKRKKDHGLPRRVYLRSGTYWFVDYTGKWHKLGRSFREAMTTWAAIADEDSPVRTMNDLIDRYMKEVAPTKAPATHHDNQKQAKLLKAAFGKLRPATITTRAVYQYMDIRGKKSQTRANRDLALLSHIFTKAIRWGVVDKNPCKGVERFKEKPRDRYITDDEYLAFRNIAGDTIAAYMDFKFLSGLRQSDILKMRLDQLRDEGIHVKISKTGKRIVIQWTDALRDAINAIKQLRRRVGSVYLFSTRKGQPYTPSGFASIWQRRMKKAIETGVLKERFTEHDLRAKTASDTDLTHAAELLAHGDAKITNRHYRQRKAAVVMPLK